MRKLIEFQPHIITPYFFDDETHLLVDHPEVINCGQCMEWAYLAYKLFQGVELWSLPFHAFVKSEEEFYDSETLGGVKSWRDLPCCSRVWRSDPIQQFSLPADFQNYWKRSGCDWLDLDSRADRLLQHWKVT